MATSTFRVSVPIWSVKHYLSAHLAVHGTTWDSIWQRPGFTWSFPSKSSVFITMEPMRGNMEGHHFLVYLLWALRFFHVSWKPPESLLQNNSWGWRSNCHVLLVFTHDIFSNNSSWVTELYFLTAWQGRWYPKPARSEVNVSPLAIGSTAIAWDEGLLW